jgi:hypothetical protein
MESLGHDVINLNVGGKRMTTTRSTLCQVERSLLADIFNHPSQEFAGLPCDVHRWFHIP